MKIGAQLYTVRDFTQTEEDLSKTLKKVSEMGYTYVHCSKIGPIPTEKIKELLDENNLICSIVNVDSELLISDPATIIKTQKALDCKEVGLSIMPERYRGSLAGLRKMIEDYSPSVKAITDAGMNFHYHNHDVEFIREGESTLLDILLEEMPDIKLLVCAFWAQVAGVDPLQLISKYHDRINIVHLKDMSVKPGSTNVGTNRMMTPILDGNMNYKEILRVCEANPNIKYAFVEQDECYGRPFECLKKSLDNITSLGYYA